jgi:hypothetical protein
MPEVDKSLTISLDDVGTWMPTLGRIALVAITRPERGFRDFLTSLNHSLQTHKLPTIHVADLMTLAAKEVVTGESSEKLERFSQFFKQLSAMGEDEHVLTLWEAFLEYARNHDDSVLRRLPLEERQLLMALKESL